MNQKIRNELKLHWSVQLYVKYKKKHCYHISNAYWEKRGITILIAYILKDFFILFERITGRERSSIHWFTLQTVMMARAGTVWISEPRTLSPTWVQWPKALGHPLPLSRAVNMELDQKWSIWDWNGCPYRMPTSQVDIACYISHQPQKLMFHKRYVCSRT